MTKIRDVRIAKDFPHEKQNICTCLVQNGGLIRVHNFFWGLIVKIGNVAMADATNVQTAVQFIEYIQAKVFKRCEIVNCFNIECNKQLFSLYSGIDRRNRYLSTLYGVYLCNNQLFDSTEVRC